jgi:GPH family glycoside/pentoside/hexuronide:cation symporter
MDKKNQAPQNVLTKHPNAIGMKEGTSYLIGEAGNMFVLTFVSSFLKVFYTDVLYIDPTQIATLLLITRLWDAINDPLWGMIVAKRAPSKNGKFRPYLKTVSIPLGISCILCFVNWAGFIDNKGLILALAYITYTAFGMMYTGMNIPFGSLASVITDDPNGRTLLSTMRAVGSGVGGGVVSLIAPMIVYSSAIKVVDGKEVKYNVADPNGMLKFAIFMGLGCVVLYMISYFTCTEKVKSEAEPKVDMKKTYLGMFTSRPFVSLALMGILISGQLQFNSFNQYLYKNYFENTTLSILGTIFNYLPVAVGVLINGKLVKKYGKQELCGATSVISAVSSIILAVLANNKSFIAMCGGKFPAWLFMAFMFLIGSGYAFISLTNWAVVTDVIDYQEYKTGLRSESAIYAVYTFSRKLGQTFADSGGMLLLGWSGYNDKINGQPIADMGYIPGVGEKLMLLCTIIPAVTYTLIFILMKYVYPLNKENLEPVYDFIRKKRVDSIEE